MSAKRIIFLSVFGLFTLIIFSIAFRWCEKVANPDIAVDTYENFYLLNDQATQICDDITVMQGADSISGGFSKTERIIGLENKLNEVIKEYNAKSRAWTKNMWKADDLPHTLKRSDFYCE